MASKSSKKAIWDVKIVRRAIVDSIVKLDPRHMMGNPVMFVVEVGSVITTVLLFQGGAAFKFNLQITLWLWFTVLDRKSTRLNSSHLGISYAVFCLKKKNNKNASHC